MKLKPPVGWKSNDIAGGVMMPDCSILRPDESGWYDFGTEPGAPGQYLHLVDHFKNQGWREPEPSRPVYASELEREVAERPMGTFELIKAIETTYPRIEMRVQDRKLLVRGDALTPLLLAHLRAWHDDVVAELLRREKLPWQFVA